MSSASIQDTVLQVASSVLKHEVQADSTRENTPRWDSLKHVELVFAIEDELGIQFDEAELGQLDSVQAIVRLAQRKHAA